MEDQQDRRTTVREDRGTIDRMEKEILGRIEMVRIRKTARTHSSAKAVDAAILHQIAMVRTVHSSARAVIDLRVALHVSLMVLEARVSLQHQWN